MEDIEQAGPNSNVMSWKGDYKDVLPSYQLFRQILILETDKMHDYHTLLFLTNK